MAELLRATTLSFFLPITIPVSISFPRAIAPNDLERAKDLAVYNDRRID